MNNLSKVALDSAAAGNEPATSSRKSNALTTAPPSHTSVYKVTVIENLEKEKRRRSKQCFTRILRGARRIETDGLLRRTDIIDSNDTIDTYISYIEASRLTPSNWRQKFGHA